MSCEGWNRSTNVAWPDDFEMACPKCGCPACLSVPTIELDKAEMRVLFLCEHGRCGHTWWKVYTLTDKKAEPASDANLTSQQRSSFDEVGV